MRTRESTAAACSLAAGAKREVLTTLRETDEGPCRSCSIKRGSHSMSRLRLHAASASSCLGKDSNRCLYARIPDFESSRGLRLVSALTISVNDNSGLTPCVESRQMLLQKAKSFATAIHDKIRHPRTDPRRQDSIVQIRVSRPGSHSEPLGTSDGFRDRLI